MKKIEIKTRYWNIAANIYFPKTFNETNKYPTIISAHPIGSCKEQTSGEIYGKALAKEGFVVIAFDASFQGESGGEPRHLENPTYRVEDFSLIIDYLLKQDYVDQDKIGVLGICGGGGYALNAALTEKRIKAVATVVPVNFGRLSREVFSNWQPLEKLQLMAKQRTNEVRGSSIQIDSMLPDSVQQAEQAGITDIDVLEATEYYKTQRGQSKNGLNQAVFSHLTTATGWDAFHLSELLLTQPIMVVVGNQVGGFGSYRDGLEIYSRACSEHKELAIIEGYSHYDLYDISEPVEQALNRITPFFKRYL